MTLSQMARSPSAAAPASPQSEEPPAASDSPKETAEGEDTPDDEPEMVALIPINFDYLETVSQNIVAWIEVEGTTIDYPVMYDETSSMYYLNHNHTGAYTPYGAVFMLSQNQPDFKDFNTVVYGHNIEGSMFGVLHQFEDQDFFDKNKTILVYTENRALCYQIFAAYRTDNLDQLQNFDTSTPEGRQEYIDRIYTHDVKAIFDPNVTVTPDDRIITLSTCIANPAYRYLVQGVLVSDYEGISIVESGENAYR